MAGPCGGAELGSGRGITWGDRKGRWVGSTQGCLQEAQLQWQGTAAQHCSSTFAFALSCGGGGQEQAEVWPPAPVDQ